MSDQRNMERDFRLGMQAALDPNNKDITSGAAQTSLRSPWLHRTCQVCGHTFRVDDPVWLEEDGEVRHMGAGLNCVAGKRDEASSDDHAFFDGLLEGWPQDPTVPVACLKGKHPLLAPPLGKYRPCRLRGVRAYPTARRQRGALPLFAPTTPLPPGNPSRSDPWHELLECLEAGHRPALLPGNLAKVGCMNFFETRTWRISLKVHRKLSGRCRRMMISFEELRQKGLLDELANVFSQQGMALMLLDEFGYPKSLIPHGTSHAQEFWFRVCREISLGLTTGNLSDLIAQAAALYPGNRRFKAVSNASWGAGRRCRVLLMAANPYGLSELRLSAEYRAVLDRLKPEPRAELDPVMAAKLDEFQSQLIYHQPDIFHFAGHGYRFGMAMETDAGHGAVPVPVLQSVVEVLNRDTQRLTCVLLNCCNSAGPAEALQGKVSMSIGHEGEIHDSAAIAFARGFYDGLATGETLKAAVELGRNQIDLEQVPGSSGVRVFTDDDDGNRILLPQERRR